jgi:hypothetical protein
VGTFAVEIPSQKWFGQVPVEVLGMVVRTDAIPQTVPFVAEVAGSFSYHRDETEALKAAGDRAQGCDTFRVWQRVLSVGDQAHVYRLVHARDVEADSDYLFSLLETLEILGEELGIEKTSDPMDPVEFHRFAVRLLRSWAPEIKTISGAYTSQYIRELEAEDWSDMTEKQIEERFDEIGKAVPSAVYAVTPAFIKDGSRFSYEIAIETRSGMVKASGMEVDNSFNLRDTKAINSLSKWSYKQIPTSYPGISEKISKTLQKELVKGLQSGLNFREVVKDVIKQVPIVATKRQVHNLNVTAQSAIARARSHSQLLTYRDARVTVIRAAAVMDDRTTPQCSFLNNQIIQVEPMLQHYNTSVANDEDPRQAFPWVANKRDKTTGDEWLEVTVGGQTERFAEKTAGGDMSWAKGYDMAVLASYGVGMPPYHALCRTTTYMDTLTF